MPSTRLTPVQQQILDLALQHQILAFGDFTLKSGRRSPYFFNLGKLSSIRALEILGAAFAEQIQQSGIHSDVIFGAAYKGIPLAIAAASAWYRRTGQDLLFAYNRKEAKIHGEGGQIVGDIAGKRIVIVDDVLTAGTAARMAIADLQAAGGIPVGLWVVLDREEPGQQGTVLARDEIRDTFHIPVYTLLPAQAVLQAAGVTPP